MLDVQTDAILVVQKSDNLIDRQQDRDRGNQVMFCNGKSVELFGTDLKENPQFSARENALQFKRLHNDRNGSINGVFESVQETVLSLENIFMKYDEQSERGMEAYSFHNALEQPPKEERTIMINRIDIEFASQPCQMINFSDITAFKQLEK